ncbi:MAG: hypothetical protein ACYTGZ_15990 [Planctomycetota bacterium]|jgi:hypothetical protein
MHGSVLQNKKYMKFAEQSTVEVIAVSQINESDPRSEKYTAKNEKGEKVEYYKSWPGLTKADMAGLNRSKARSYNKSGKIPYISVVNPHTQEEIRGWNGGGGSTIMDAVKEAQKALTKQYGKPVSRKTLKKVRAEEKKALALLKDGDLGKAWSTYAALAKKTAKQGDAIKVIVKNIQNDLLVASEKKLIELEALVARGETKVAAKELRTFARSLKGTRLEERAKALALKIKPPKA